MDVIFKSWYTIWLEWLMNGIPHPFLLILIVLSSFILVLLIVISIFSAILTVSWIYVKTVSFLTDILYFILRQIRQINALSFQNRNIISDRIVQQKSVSAQIKAKSVASAKSPSSAIQKQHASAVTERLQLGFCKKHSFAELNLHPKQFTRDILYINKNTQSKEAPYLQRPYLRFRDRLFVRTRIPPGVEIYTVFPEGDDVPIPQWPHSPAKTSGYPTPKQALTPPPSSRLSEADATGHRTPPLSPISDHSSNNNTPPTEQL